MNQLLIDVLRELIVQAYRSIDDDYNDFSQGVVTGYYNCISHMLNQVKSFGLMDQLPDDLRNFIPEDLLKRK